MFAISMTTSSQGNQTFKSELDQVNLVFIDDRTAELISGELILSILNRQIENKLLTKLLMLKQQLNLQETSYLLLTDLENSAFSADFVSHPLFDWLK